MIYGVSPLSWASGWIMLALERLVGRVHGGQRASRLRALPNQNLLAYSRDQWKLGITPCNVWVFPPKIMCRSLP